MKKYLWMLRHRVATWGPKLALFLLIVVGAFWLAVLRPLQQQVSAVEQNRLTQRETKLRTLDLERSAPPAERLSRFYRFFSDGESITDHLARLYAIAESNQILLRRAEYRMIAQADQRISRYQIVMPIQGTYPAIRLFASQALAEMPMLALSQVQFQRKEIGDGQGEAQMTFTLYLAK